jgi:hypothetical protein
MAEVTFRLPSKMTQYGYVEIAVEADTSDPVALGRRYDDYVKAFQRGEMNKPAPAPALVSPPVESPEANADELLKGELGAKVVPEEVAPWDEPAPPKAEPWKNPPAIEDLFA